MEPVGRQAALADSRSWKELAMTNRALIQTTQLAFSMAAVLLAYLLLRRGQTQQYSQSAGWHGGKTKG
jgi:hypothetical protein